MNGFLHGIKEKPMIGKGEKMQENLPGGYNGKVLHVDPDMGGVVGFQSQRDIPCRRMFSPIFDDYGRQGWRLSIKQYDSRYCAAHISRRILEFDLRLFFAVGVSQVSNNSIGVGYPLKGVAIVY